VPAVRRGRPDHPGCAGGGSGQRSTLGIQASAKDSGRRNLQRRNPDKCEHLVRAQPRRRRNPQNQGRCHRIAPVENRRDQRRPDLDSRAHAKPGHAGERMAAEPGVTKLMFDPRSTRCLSPTRPNISLTRPSDVVNVAIAKSLTRWTETFGSGVGTFKCATVRTPTCWSRTPLLQARKGEVNRFRPHKSFSRLTAAVAFFCWRCLPRGRILRTMNSHSQLEPASWPDNSLTMQISDTPLC